MASSPIPNHRMTSGMMARCGTLRSICIEESNSRLGRPRDARQYAEDEADAAADEQALQRPLGGDCGVGEKRAVAQALPEGDGDRARRRQHARRQQAAIARRSPRRRPGRSAAPSGEQPERRFAGFPKLRGSGHASGRLSRSRPDLVGDGLAERAGVDGERQPAPDACASGSNGKTSSAKR